MFRKVSSVYVLVHSGFVSRCCPMADSKFILDFMSDEKGFQYVRNVAAFHAVLKLQALLNKTVQINE